MTQARTQARAFRRNGKKTDGTMIISSSAAWRRLARALAGAFCLLLTAPVMADAAGEQLALRVYDRPNGKDSTSVVNMILTERGHSPRNRQMITYRLDKKGGEVATLIRFTEPADIEGTGLLTLDKADGDSDQWIYLPAMERVRRISSSRKGGSFVNSDYYYEDLRDRKVDQDEHRIIGRENIGGLECDVLESVPTSSGNSVYSKRISWIDPATLMPLRIDFYERRADTPSKRWELLRRGRVQGYWTVLDSAMTDLGSGHQTRLRVEWMRYDRRLPSSLFTSRALEDERVEAEYRP